MIVQTQNQQSSLNNANLSSNINGRKRANQQTRKNLQIQPKYKHDGKQQISVSRQHDSNNQKKGKLTNVNWIKFNGILIRQNREKEKSRQQARLNSANLSGKANEQIPVVLVHPTNQQNDHFTHYFDDKFISNLV